MTTLFGVDDGSFHRREITWQRAGRVLLATFIVAGFLGAFGSGPLSNATARSADRGLELHYERWTRGQSSTELRLYGVKAQRGRVVRLWLNKEFSHAIHVERMVPEAERWIAGSERMEFDVPVHADGGGPLEIAIRYQAIRIGLVRGTIGVADDPPVRFTQFVYP